MTSTNESKSLIIVVSGYPGAGKSELARRLAASLECPLLSKDGIKEIIFSELGWKQKTWTVRFGALSYKLFYFFLDQLLKGGVSPIVLESNFIPKYDQPQFMKLLRRYDVQIQELHCRGKKDVLWDRYRDRVMNGKRHPGYINHPTRERFLEMLSKAEHSPLAIGADWIEVDTTNSQVRIRRRWNDNIRPDSQK